MHERRGKPGVKDSGARTRQSDHGQTPHAEQEWVSTYQLRWSEHVQKHDSEVKHAA